MLSGEKDMVGLALADSSNASALTGAEASICINAARLTYCNLSAQLRVSLDNKWTPVTLVASVSLSGPWLSSH